MLFDLIKRQKVNLILKLLKICLINSLFSNQKCFLNFIQLSMKKNPNIQAPGLSNKVIIKKRLLVIP
jgi:hypothetical protein